MLRIGRFGAGAARHAQGTARPPGGALEDSKGPASRVIHPSEQGLEASGGLHFSCVVLCYFVVLRDPAALPPPWLGWLFFFPGQRRLRHEFLPPLPCILLQFPRCSRLS
jgi:hypothetical protein